MANSAPHITFTVRGRTPNLVLATAASVVCFWAWNVVATLGARYTQQLHLSPATTGVLVAMPVFVGSLGRIIVGTLTERFGGRVMFTFVLLATVGPVLLVVLGGTIESFILVLIAGLLLGVAGTVFAVGIPSVPGTNRPDAGSPPGFSAQGWVAPPLRPFSIPGWWPRSATSPRTF